jgi:hypothetical protein
MDFGFSSLDSNATPGREEDIHSYSCTLAITDARYDSKGKLVVLEAGLRRERDLTRRAERHTTSVLELVRYYNVYKVLEKTELKIKSPFIIGILREVIKEYPGLNFNTDEVVIQDTPMCLFHYRKELAEYGQTLRPERNGDETKAQHLLFVLQYMYFHLQSALTSFTTFMESPTLGNVPGIDYENLWTIFRPGTPIYLKAGLHKRENVVLFYKMARCMCLVPRCPNDVWVIETHQISHDGDEYGYVRLTFTISRYEGYQALTDLRVFPLEYHPNCHTIRKRLVARGRKYLSLKGVHNRAYNGVCKTLSPFRGPTRSDDDDDDDGSTTLTYSPVRIQLFCEELSY